MNGPAAVPVRVIVVGSELLEGRVRDRNTARVAAAVRDRGGRVEESRVVPDDEDAIRGAVRDALCRGVPAVVCGGIGPTPDDRTRDAVASALGRELEERPEWGETVRDRARGPGITRRGRRRQTRLPSGARLLGNPRGTTAAFACRSDDAWILVLPGVPSELEGLLEGPAGDFLDEVLPGGSFPRRRVGIAGVPESEIADELESMPHLGVRIASYPRAGVVDLYLVPEADDPSVLGPAVDAVRARFGEAVYEVGERELPGVVLDLMEAAHRTLAVAESCTGGLAGGALTSVPGSSAVFVGGAICYADRAKVDQVGVRPPTLEAHGAVSGPVAREMAEGARARFGADRAVSITGIAGPGGGRPDRPVGTVWIGLAGVEGSSARHHLFPGGRAEVRRRSVRAALDRVRRAESGGAGSGGPARSS